MNPLMSAMGGTAPARGGINPQTIQQVRRMMNILRGAANPQQAVMRAAQMNPALGAAVRMCQGRSPKDVFYEQCRQHGVNPDDVINMLQ